MLAFIIINYSKENKRLRTYKTEKDNNLITVKIYHSTHGISLNIQICIIRSKVFENADFSANFRSHMSLS